VIKHTLWQKKDHPSLVLAPMADVTDAACRRIVAKYGRPDVIWTEFVSCDGLCSAAGRERLLIDLWFDQVERPVVAQLFGAKPDTFRQAARLCAELGYDGIDINMGCPERNIVKQGSCSALINNPPLAKEIIRATQEGAGGLPVSVKTRLGFNRNIMAEWIGQLIEARPALITLHGRTRKEMSKVPANWEAISEAARLTQAAGIPLIGNGDVADYADAQAKIAQYGVDGVMIGRAAMGNPWVFRADLDPFSLTLREKTEVMLEHAFLYEKLFAGIKGFVTMRKHFKAYVAGFPRTKELRLALMQVESATEAAAAVKSFLATHGDSTMVGSSYFVERFGG